MPDHKEIEQAYIRWGPMMYRRILRFYDEDEAQEVLHEVFEKLLGQWPTLKGEGAPTAWLYRVVTNHCLNRVRDQSRRRELLREHHAKRPWENHEPARQADRVLFGELWRQLPEELLTMAIYYYVDGMSHAEIARVVGVSRRTVGNRLQDFERHAAKLRNKESSG